MSSGAMAQGYFIAQPMPAEDLVTWKQAWNADPFV